MKKTLLIILIIIIVGALILLGYYFIYKPSYQNQSQPASNSTQQNQTQNQTQTQNNSSTVSIANFAFDPADLTVKAGTEVTWTNNDSTTHTINFDSFNSGDVAPGSTYKHTFADKGTFNYHCSIHPSMQGKVTVQ